MHMQQSHLKPVEHSHLVVGQLSLWDLPLAVHIQRLQKRMHQGRVSPQHLVVQGCAAAPAALAPGARRCQAQQACRQEGTEYGLGS